jgi:large conductance mechanosensitive channel
MPMFRGFRDFILRGNVMDLAVAVVVGAAFGAVVTSFVGNVLTPLIAAVAGKPDFSALSWTVSGSEIKYGLFLNALISFLLIGAAVYFAMVAPMNAWKARQAKGQASADPATKSCLACMETIAIGASRCKWCGEAQPGGGKLAA